jgi:hypothetical protein
MQAAGMKRKYDDHSEEDSTSDDTWTPGSTAQPESPPSKVMAVSTRSRGPTVNPDPKSVDAALDAADGVVNNESDLSSDTDEEEEEESSCSEEEEEE